MFLSQNVHGILFLAYKVCNFEYMFFGCEPVKRQLRCMESLKQECFAMETSSGQYLSVHPKCRQNKKYRKRKFKRKLLFEYLYVNRLMDSFYYYFL